VVGWPAMAPPLFSPKARSGCLVFETATVASVGAAGTTGAVLPSNSNTTCVDFGNKLAFYNITTPNGDGQNDVFIIDNATRYLGNSLSIYNR
jgi:hypothetical protein